MISLDKIKVGDKILTKSMICKHPVIVRVNEITNGKLYVTDLVSLPTRVELSDCWYNTETNRNRIVNHHPY